MFYARILAGVLYLLAVIPVAYLCGAVWGCWLGVRNLVKGT